MTNETVPIPQGERKARLTSHVARLQKAGCKALFGSLDTWKYLCLLKRAPLFLNFTLYANKNYLAIVWPRPQDKK